MNTQRLGDCVYNRTHDIVDRFMLFLDGDRFPFSFLIAAVSLPTDVIECLRCDSVLPWSTAHFFRKI